MTSLEWDSDDIPWDPKERTAPGVYRLSSLDKRMYAFIMRDSLEIMRNFQNAEGKDLVPYEDRVDPPSGLKTSELESLRKSKGIQNWQYGLRSGKKKELERDMMSSLAGTEIADASWFPDSISALDLAQYRSGISGSLSVLGMGGIAGQGGGMPGMGMGMPGMGMGMGMPGMGMGGMGGMGGPMGGMGGISVPGGGYGGLGNVQTFSPAAGAMGIASF
jgi:hypothetical protein